jgi:GT2 family glycosyltransferase
VAFLDQDDRWHEEKLLLQVPVLNRAEVSVAYVESFWSWPPGVTGRRRADQPRSGAVPGYVSGTMVARREVFARVGRFRPEYRYADSLDWFARAAETRVNVELLPRVLLYHRVHDANLSRRGAESRAECARILKRALDRRRARAASASPE